jgi:hypothetical protein
MKRNSLVDVFCETINYEYENRKLASGQKPEGSPVSGNREESGR